MQAFKVNAVDYLLKPVDPEDLSKALARVQERGSGFDVQALAQYFHKRNLQRAFLVRIGQHMSFLSVADVAYFRSSDGLTQAYTTSGKKHFIDHTLEEIERMLDPGVFFRISRQMILGLNAIERIAPHFNGRLKIEVNPPASEEVFVSRERVGAFKTWLGG
ncbi:MAG: response regulator transcription factor [Lewinellaceae bacterium]|nr:response regulator transcription factor [Lewinellaceae bacterium]